MSRTGESAHVVPTQTSHSTRLRDCAYKNVMMDATPLFPHGFHPIADDMLPDTIATWAPRLPRATTPVKYYYIDFGISSRFADDDVCRLVTGRNGLDRTVPELSRTVPYDPFKVDIFILGNLFRQQFSEVSPAPHAPSTYQWFHHDAWLRNSRTSTCLPRSCSG